MVKSYTSLRQDINMFKDLKEIMNIMREEIEDLIIEVETIKGQIPDGKIFTIWNE